MNIPGSTAMPSSRFRNAFDATSQLVWILRPDGVITDVNKTAATTLGRDKTEIIGQSFSAATWWGEASRTRIEALLTRVHDAAVRDEVEVVQNTASMWLELGLKAVTDGQGDIDFIIAEGKDITVRKTMLMELEESETRLEESQALAHLGSWMWDSKDNAFTWSDGLYRILGIPPRQETLTYQDYVNIIHPDDREPILASVADAFQKRQPKDFYHRMVRPDGGIRMVHGVWKIETDAEGNVTRVVGTAQDITELRETEDRLAQTILRLSTLSNIAQAVASSLDENVVYERVVSALRPLLNAEAVAVFLREGDKLVIRAAESSGLDHITLVGNHIPTTDGVAGHVWRTGEALLLRGKECTRRIDNKLAEKLGYTPEVLIAVPMWWQDQHIGVLEAFHRDVTVFTQEDLRLFETAAVWLAIAIINARLWEGQQQARRIAESRRERMRLLTRRVVSAQEDERQRIASDLHDDAGQALTALKISLSLLEQSTLDADIRESLGEAVDLTDQTMENIRYLAHNLRPPALDSFGLDATLGGLAQEFAYRTQIKVNYKGMDLPPLPDETATVLYRFVQEALTNIAKHANATIVNIIFHREDGMLVIEVSDNGVGFNVQATRGGIGLAGMSERFELLEGALEITSTEGQGTTVIAKVAL